MEGSVNAQKSDQVYRVGDPTREQRHSELGPKFQHSTPTSTTTNLGPVHCITSRSPRCAPSIAMNTMFRSVTRLARPALASPLAQSPR